MPESIQIYKTETSKVSELKPGHDYEIECRNEGKELMGIAILLNFQDGAVKEVGGRNGLQNEELIAILIHRMKYLNEKFPCRENEIAITSLEVALLALEARTARRQFQGVEGQDKQHES